LRNRVVFLDTLRISPQAGTNLNGIASGDHRVECSLGIDVVNVVSISVDVNVDIDFDLQIPLFAPYSVYIGCRRVSTSAKKENPDEAIVGAFLAALR